MECKRILAVLDFSDNTGKVLEYTRHWACQEKASVCLLHPEPPQSGYAYLAPGPGYSGFLGFGEQAVLNQEVQSVLLDNDRKALELVQKELEKTGINAEIRLLIGDRTEQIVKAAEEFKSDLIIMGGHQQSFFADILFGNNEKTLIRKTPCPLLIIPEK